MTVMDWVCIIIAVFCCILVCMTPLIAEWLKLGDEDGSDIELGSDFYPRKKDE